MAFTGTSRFQVLGKLGEGGMGIVYEAYDRARGMRVALKSLRRVDATNLYRFKREFRSLSDLSHPNIITLYELISEGEEWFFTMELVEGQDFVAHVRGGRVPRIADTPSLPDEDLTRTGVALTVSAMLATASQPLLGTRAAARPITSTPTSTPTGKSTSKSTSKSTGKSTGSTDGLPALPAQREAFHEIVDEHRLRNALGQLARALHVLHAAGMVHRDLKPSNVRVTAAGRVVLMDFGMVAEAHQPIDLGRAGAAVGTPAFVAPEQVVGDQPTAAADWYALGVMLYVTLTERLPYEGSILEVIDAKRERDPLPPSTFVDGIPPDLEHLCMALLQRDPTQRPCDNEVLARLGVPERSDTAESGKIAAPELLDSSAFVGRKHELQALHQAYAQIRHGSTLCVFVQGLSGMGKTCLVEHFVEELDAMGQPAAPVVLAGRCHERESLPYKAFDGVIDSLTGRLLAMDDADRAAVLPPAAALISRLFPVLRRVPGLEDGAQRTGHRNPVETRVQAIAALRALLAGLAHSTPIIIRIEDVQWADAESLELLLSLVRAPAPERLLVVCTVRAEDLEPASEGTASRVAQGIALLERLAECRRVVLGPLTEVEQRELMARLIQRHRDLRGRVDDQLWHDAAGSPMLLVELARYAEEAPDELEPATKLRLEDIIWRRVTRLPETARALMEVIALAGEPTPLDVLADAIGLSSIERERAASVLRVAQLARTTQAERGPWLSAYHDKVREAVAARLDSERTRTLHGQLAQALEMWGLAPVARMARHCMAAGEYERAATYLIDAARSAAEQLAFERAAELYRTALGLVPESSGDPRLERLRCQAWIGLAEGMRLRDQTSEAMDVLDRALSVASEHRLSYELATIHYLRGSLLFPRGDLDGCLAEHEKARTHARQSGSPEREAQALSGLGDAYYMRGRMISAYEHFTRCIALCRRHGFLDIEGANLAMRGMTRYYQNDLDAALRDSIDAAVLAEQSGHQRAEIVARNGCIGWILYELGRLDEAEREFTRALDMARRLGMRRFEPNSLTWLGKILALRGQRDQAQELVAQSVAGCRETGFAFVGPMALGALALVTPDPAVRQRAVDEGETFLRSGCASHNYLYFYRDAMDALLAAGELEQAGQCASALERYTQAEPLPWSQFFIERTRALVRFSSGAHDSATAAELERLRAEAYRVGLRTAAQALERALTELRAAAASARS